MIDKKIKSIFNLTPKIALLLLTVIVNLLSCYHSAENYFDNTGRDDLLSGGVKIIKISTPKGEFNVWQRRFGNNPTFKGLTLNGGPAANHEYFKAFTGYSPGAALDYYYYDQPDPT